MKIETRYRGKFLSEYTKEELLASIEEMATAIQNTIEEYRHGREVLG